jgi:hypothetical protein
MRPSRTGCWVSSGGIPAGVRDPAAGETVADLEGLADPDEYRKVLGRVSDPDAVIGVRGPQSRSCCAKSAGWTPPS